MRYQTMFLAHRILARTAGSAKKPSTRSSATVLPELPEKDAAISVSLVFVAVDVCVDYCMQVLQIENSIAMTTFTDHT